MTESSGTCGPVPDGVTRQNPTLNSIGNGCALDADDDLSADKCSLSRSATCPTDDGGTISLVGVVKEQDGGAKLTGLLTVTLRNEAGSAVCMGTYDATYTRQ
jgi:hypothetical protein